MTNGMIADDPKNRASLRFLISQDFSLEHANALQHVKSSTSGELKTAWAGDINFGDTKFGLFIRRHFRYFTILQKKNIIFFSRLE